MDEAYIPLQDYAELQEEVLDPKAVARRQANPSKFMRARAKPEMKQDIQRPQQRHSTSRYTTMTDSKV